MRLRRPIFLAAIFLLLAAGAIAQKPQVQKPGARAAEPAAPSTAPAQATSPAPQPTAEAETEGRDSGPWGGLNWRLIGPFRGGRAIAVTGVRNDPNTYYFGAVAGGVWKTTDSGLTWRPIADKEKITSVGGMAVADSDPNVIYVGTGEACPRGNIVEGDGVYKSTDAGKSWQFTGLRETRHIGKVIVHPRNPDVVFVAALGNVYAPNAERGVFRSTDGGKNWQRVLFRDESTGAIDVTFDPNNPSIVFAALWQAHRKPWLAESGGPGSGLYRSSDGGTTWKRLEGNGLPTGILGRIGVAVSPANSNRVWALIEAKEGGLYRSDDGGENWRRTTSDHRFTQRAWYYMHLAADPQSAETVYILNTGLFRSTDGGSRFTNIPATHPDHHGLWIDPANPKRMINANDGGAAISSNGGQTWSSIENQPTAQFYHVATDNAFPYRVYGAQQDNSTVSIASRTDGGSIGRADYYDAGGCESGYIAPDPRDNNIVYAGCYGGHITRLDRRSGQEQEINAWPVNPIGYGAAELRHRFQWTAPIVLSPHDPDVLYHAAEVLFRSNNGGMSWTAISPDLTRNDRSKQQSSGGPLTKDNTSVEYYNTIFTVAESVKQRDLIWAGTDDGLVHLTRDGGKTWSNVTPRGIPEWATVSLIEASPHDPAVAFVAVDNHRQGDWKPYIFRTGDFGKSWTSLAANLPDGAYVHAVREDPVRRGLLFAGTELGVFASFNDGGAWETIRGNMPQVQIADLVVKEDDLVVATHGRSFWILDDVSALRQHKPEVLQADVHLYAPRRTYRMRGGFGGAASPTAGQNAPSGVVLQYRLKTSLEPKKDDPKKGDPAKDDAKPEGGAAAETDSAGGAARPSPVAIEIYDSAGKLLRKYPAPPADAPEDGESPPQRGAGNPPAKAGLNRFVWNFRQEDVARVPGTVMWGGSTRGAMVLPGTYEVRLTAGGKTYKAPVEIVPDPRVKTSPAGLAKQFELLNRIQRRVGEAHEAVNQIREVRRQVQDLGKRLRGQSGAQPVLDAARQLEAKLTPIEQELIQTRSRSNQDPLNYPIKLNNQLAALFSVVDSADTAPTEQSYKVLDELSSRLDKQLAEWNALQQGPLAAFNELVRKQSVPAIIVAPAAPAAPPRSE